MPIGVMTQLHDDKVVKALQTDAKRIRENTAALLDCMSEFVVLIREDFTVEYMNKSAASIWKGILGQSCYQVFMGRRHACTDDCPLRAVMEGSWEGRLFQKQIRDRHVEISAVPFKGYKNEHLALLVMRDDTQRKELEERLKRLNEFMSQEIRSKIEELKDIDGLKERLLLEVDKLEDQVKKREILDRFIGCSEQIQNIRHQIQMIAPTNLTVLVTGESGTGKELVASLIHHLSPRSAGPFIKVNCSAISESLLESELFGHERGAFTGAVGRHKGKFELADKGTLFLDEIGDISPKMQVALLRALETGEIHRVGAEQALKVDVRVIAATNVDLEKAVKKGRFREDLFYRLNVVNLHIPPLRERTEDIILLATNFIKTYRTRLNKPIDFISADVRDKLLQYNWPGNVRQLKNVLLRAMIFAKDNELRPEDIVFEAKASQVQEMMQEHNPSHRVRPGLEEKLRKMPLKDSLAFIEEQLIRFALESSNGNTLKAASRLGISKSLIYVKLRQYNIDPKKFKR